MWVHARPRKGGIKRGIQRIHVRLRNRIGHISHEEQGAHARAADDPIHGVRLQRHKPLLPPNLSIGKRLPPQPAVKAVMRIRHRAGPLEINLDEDEPAVALQPLVVAVGPVAVGRLSKAGRLQVVEASPTPTASSAG